MSDQPSVPPTDPIQTTPGVLEETDESTDQESVEVIQIGPGCFASSDLSVINLLGENYYKTCDVIVGDLPEGGVSYCTKRLDHPGILHEDYNGRTMLEVQKSDSNLLKHAQQELAMIGEEEFTVDGYLKMIQIFSEMGHSGGSASVFIPTLNALLWHKNLAPLTDNPDEWIHHDDKTMPPDGIWQNIRDSSAFSRDEGKTYYFVNEDREHFYESAHFE